MDKIETLGSRVGIIIGILIVIIIAVVWTRNANNEEIGEMVCSERGYGEFINYDSENKTIKCAPASIKEKYDGDDMRNGLIR